MASYEVTKEEALGLRMPDGQQSDPFSVRIPFAKTGNLFANMEVSLQEREELRQRRENLREFPEYPPDEESAAHLLKRLLNLLENGAPEGLQAFFWEHPAAEWLSLVFLDEQQTKQLRARVRGAGASAKQQLREHIERQTMRMVNYQGLFRTLWEAAK